MDCPLTNSTMRMTRATEKANIDSDDNDDTNQRRVLLLDPEALCTACRTQNEPKLAKSANHDRDRSQLGVAKGSRTRSDLLDYGSICDLPPSPN